MQSANNLLKEFCQSIGMEALGFDEDGQRSLSFDEKIVFSFLGDDDDGLTAISFIGNIPNSFDVARVFLEQNFLAEAHGGARFALEPKSERVIMTCRWNAIKTSVPELSNDLEAMVNSAIRAQEFLVNPPSLKQDDNLPTGGMGDASAPGAQPDSLSMAYQNTL